MRKTDGPGAPASAAEAGIETWEQGLDTNSDLVEQAARALQRRTPVDAALFYAAQGWPVFPCRPDKRPLTDHGFHDSSTEESDIQQWWHRWTDALVGIATGAASGLVVLDIDVKRPAQQGFDTLEELGFASLPETPMVHTPSGGLHVYFHVPDHELLPSTQGEQGRGIGRGLDWRGQGGYIIAPSPNSGYWWDPFWNISTVGLAPVPISLLPRERERSNPARPIRPTPGLSRYAEAALDKATQAIINAPNGLQEATLNSECFSLGKLAGARGIPAEFALKVLLWAARKMRDYDPRRPWRRVDLELKISRSFSDGMRQPRSDRRAA